MDIADLIIPVWGELSLRMFLLGRTCSHFVLKILPLFKPCSVVTFIGVTVCFSSRKEFSRHMSHCALLSRHLCVVSLYLLPHQLLRGESLTYNFTRSVAT